MAYDESLAARIRDILIQHSDVLEKKMMGGLCFMVNDKMCVGVIKNDLMARISPDDYAVALQRKGCREMDFTGRPMKGFIFVSPEGTEYDADLEYWIRLALKFNPEARASKNTKKRS